MESAEGINCLIDAGGMVLIFFKWISQSHECTAFNYDYAYYCSGSDQYINSLFTEGIMQLPWRCSGYKIQLIFHSPEEGVSHSSEKGQDLWG